MTRELLDDVDAELRSHLELASQYHAARLEDPVRGRAHALERFGDIERARRAVLDVHRSPWRRAVRWLTEVSSLALSYGGLVAVCAVLLGLHHRLPSTFQQGSGWISVWQASEDGLSTSLSRYTDFLSLSERGDVFQHVFAVRYESQVVSGAFPTEVARLKVVSPGYPRAIGAAVVLGRTLEEGDEGAAIALLTHRAWARWYGSAGGVLGQEISIAGTPHAIVGVLGPDVEFFYDSQLVVPMSGQAESRAGSPRLLLGARLATDMDIRTAQSAVASGGTSEARLVPVTRAYAVPYSKVTMALAALLTLLAVGTTYGAYGRGIPIAGAPTSGQRIYRNETTVACGLLCGAALGTMLAPTTGALIVGKANHPFDFTVSAGVALISLLTVLGSVALTRWFSSRSRRLHASRSSLGWPVLGHVCASVLTVTFLLPVLRDFLDQQVVPPSDDLLIASVLSGDEDARESVWRGAFGGVGDWAFASGLPGFDRRNRTEVRTADGVRAVVGLNEVSRDFFDVSGIALLEGRLPHRSGGIGELIIDRATCDRLFGNADPLGRLLRVDGDGVDARVVGVSESVRYGPGEDAPTVYRLAATGAEVGLLAFRRGGSRARVGLGPDVLGPLHVGELTAAGNRLARLGVVMASVLGTIQLMILFSAVRKWSLGVWIRLSGPLIFRRTMGASRRHLAECLAKRLAPPALGGLLLAVACIGLAAFVGPSVEAAPVEGVLITLAATLGGVMPAIGMALALEAPTTIDAVRTV